MLIHTFYSPIRTKISQQRNPHISSNGPPLTPRRWCCGSDRFLDTPPYHKMLDHMCCMVPKLSALRWEPYTSVPHGHVLVPLFAHLEAPATAPTPQAGGLVMPEAVAKLCAAAFAFLVPQPPSWPLDEWTLVTSTRWLAVRHAHD
jgi:hypothetical protein